MTNKAKFNRRTFVPPIFRAILLIFIVSNIDAKNTPEFQQYLASMLYANCHDKAIDVKVDLLKPIYKTFPGPQSKTDINQLVALLDTYSWQRYDTGWSEGNGRNGEKAVKCGEHALDINGESY